MWLHSLALVVILVFNEICVESSSQFLVGSWNISTGSIFKTTPPCFSLQTMVSAVVSFDFYNKYCNWERQGYSLILLFGGFTFPLTSLTTIGSGTLIYSDKLEIYDVRATKWYTFEPQQPHSAPSARGGHSAGILFNNSQTIVFGGCNNTHSFSDAFLFVTDINVFEINSNTSQYYWRKISIQGSEPPPRWGHAMLPMNNSIVIYGGYLQPLSMHPFFSL